MNQYLEIFTAVEKTIKEQSKLNDIEFEERFEKFKHLKGKNWSDNEYFLKIVEIIFYSGIKASLIAKHIDTIISHFSDYELVSKYDSNSINSILNDPDMIKHRGKIEACIKNAKIFCEIIDKHGSFSSYINSFNPDKSFNNLMVFRDEIERKFSYLGKITSYHFLTDIGLPVLKPDRVIRRIFFRLGLISEENDLLKAVMEGRKFAEETGHPIRYIDIIFVKYGQQGNDDYYGNVTGICLEKNPTCEICRVKDFCKF